MIQIINILNNTKIKFEFPKIMVQGTSESLAMSIQVNKALIPNFCEFTF